MPRGAALVAAAAAAGRNANDGRVKSEERRGRRARSASKRLPWLALRAPFSIQVQDPQAGGHEAGFVEHALKTDGHRFDHVRGTTAWTVVAQRVHALVRRIDGHVIRQE